VFKTIFTCPRCGRRSSYEGIVEQAATKARNIWVGIFTDEKPYNPAHKTEPALMCSTCAGKLGELLKRVADKYIATKDPKAKAAEKGVGRLKKLVENNNMQGDTLATEALAEVDALDEETLVLPGDLQAHFNCKTCGMGPDGTKPETGVVRIGLQIVDTKGKWVQQFLGAHVSRYGNGKQLGLSLNGNYRGIWGRTRDMLYNRAKLYPARLDIRTFCSECGDKAAVAVTYKGGGGTVSGDQVVPDFMKKLQTKEIKL